MSHFCKHARPLLALIALGTACIAGSPAYAQYSYVTIDDPRSTSYEGTYATALNDVGQIVGYSYDSQNHQHAFLETNGVFTVADAPGSPIDTNPVGINNAGQIVGEGFDASGYQYNYLETNGAFSAVIDPDAAYYTYPVGISNAGQVVGSYTGPNGNGSFTSHGFIETNGVFTTLDEPNATFGTGISGINQSGQIAGNYGDAVGNHGFLDTNGIFTVVDVPGGYSTNVTGLNDAGVVVGTFSTSRVQHGFVDIANRLTIIDEPNAVAAWPYGNISTSVNGINNAGQIVGSYLDASGYSHGFLATPLPRPTALTATVSGSAVVLNWQAEAGSILRYDVYRGTTPGGETLYQSTGTATTFTDSALTPGTPYFYTVKAVSSLGTSFPSNEVTATAPLVPAAPTNLGATAGNAQATLTWTAPAGTVTSYTLYRGTSASSLTALKSGITTTTFTNVLLKNGTTYYYAIAAVNSAGTGAKSSTVSATPTAPALPGTPTNLQAVTGNLQATLNWTAPAGTVTSYTLYRGTSTTSLTALKTGITATTFTNILLKHGTTYYYTVKAVNSAGTGPASNEVSATP